MNIPTFSGSEQKIEFNAKKQFDGPSIFQIANCAIQKCLQIKDAENHRIGISLTKMLQRYGSPILSRELVKFVLQITDESKGLISNKSTTKSLFDLANERIAENLSEWLETSLKRLL